MMPKPTMPRPIRSAIFPFREQPGVQHQLLCIPGTLQVLRLWRAPARLDDGAPLWLGSTQSLAWTHPLHAFGLWRPVEDGGGAHAALRDALDDAFPATESGGDGTRMLRVRTDALPAQPAGDPAK